MHGHRRLHIRWERRDDTHEALLGLAACLIAYRHVRRRLCWGLSQDTRQEGTGPFMLRAGQDVVRGSLARTASMTVGQETPRAAAIRAIGIRSVTTLFNARITARAPARGATAGFRPVVFG
ncbi:hypothetical protein ACFV2H_05935 [Streptomyces sp. NPDC059629]|uniref:hypothetical protein n=1 Tax=Streptomyces sp. NPDC059629 TaxID=3346889 RepID=UPI0036A22FA2